MKRALKRFVCLLITLLAIAFCVTCYIQSLKMAQNTKVYVYILSGLLVVVGLVFGFGFNPFLHEMGHLLFGVCNKFEVIRFSVLFFHFEKYGKKFKFSVKKNQFGGMVGLVSKSEKNLYKRYFLLTLGGLIGSTIATALLIVLALVFVKNFLLCSFFVGAVATSIYILAINSIPMATNGAYNDSAVLCGIAKKDKVCQATVSMMQAQSQLMQGKSPCEVERGYIFEMDKVPQNTLISVQQNNMQYLYYLDSGDIQSMDKVCKSLAEQSKMLPEFLAESIYADLLYYALICGNEADAQKYFEKSAEFLTEDQNVCNLRILATYEVYAKKNFNLAKQMIDTALQVADEYVISGIAKMEKKILNNLLEVVSKQMQ